jgi:cytochrome c553
MMKLRAMLVFSAACGLLLGQMCFADGSAEKGQAKSAPCAACHGADGNSVNPQWPSLAGQHSQYIIKQLHAFKSGTRQNPLMTPMAQPLSNEDIEDLAAYFSKQVRRGGEADPTKLSLGQRIFRGGDNDSGVPACQACHGPRGNGNPTALYPSIHGQQSTYVAETLKAYRAGTRQTDQNQMMRNVASRMTDEEIEAVAAYVQGLR